MTRRRWIADEVAGDRAALTGAHAEHLGRVLRARVGMEFDIAADDRLRRGRVSSVSDQRVEFDLGEDVDAAAESNITVCLAVIKFDRFEWAVEKLTELGVKSIVPVVASRTDAHLAAAAAKRAERWRRIAREAAEQSRRVAPPEICEPTKLKALLVSDAACRIVLAETEENTSLTDAMEAAGSAASYRLAIGPEGGWTKDELAQFAAAGWKSATLGPTILRAETAAIAALAIAQPMLR